MPQPQDITATELRENFGDFVNRTAYGGERFKIHRHGRPIAVMVTMEDLRTIEAIKAAQQAQIAIVIDGTPVLAS